MKILSLISHFFAFVCSDVFPIEDFVIITPANSNTNIPSNVKIRPSGVVMQLTSLGGAYMTSKDSFTPGYRWNLLLQKPNINGAGVTLLYSVGTTDTTRDEINFRWTGNNPLTVETNVFRQNIPVMASRRYAVDTGHGFFELGLEISKSGSLKWYFNDRIIQEAKTSFGFGLDNVNASLTIGINLFDASDPSQNNLGGIFYTVAGVSNYGLGKQIQYRFTLGGYEVIPVSD